MKPDVGILDGLAGQGTAQRTLRPGDGLTVGAVQRERLRRGVPHVGRLLEPVHRRQRLVEHGQAAIGIHHGHAIGRHARHRVHRARCGIGRQHGDRWRPAHFGVRRPAVGGVLRHAPGNQPGTDRARQEHGGQHQTMGIGMRLRIGHGHRHPDAQRHGQGGKHHRPQASLPLPGGVENQALQTEPEKDQPDRHRRWQTRHQRHGPRVATRVRAGHQAHAPRGQQKSGGQLDAGPARRTRPWPGHHGGRHRSHEQQQRCSLAGVRGRRAHQSGRVDRGSLHDPGNGGNGRGRPEQQADQALTKQQRQQGRGRQQQGQGMGQGHPGIQPHGACQTVETGRARGDQGGRDQRSHTQQHRCGSGQARCHARHRVARFQGQSGVKCHARHQRVIHVAAYCAAIISPHHAENVNAP